MQGTHFARRHSIDDLNMSSFICMDMLMKLVSNNLVSKLFQGSQEWKPYNMHEIRERTLQLNSFRGRCSWYGGFKLELNWKNSEE